VAGWCTRIYAGVVAIDLLVREEIRPLLAAPSRRALVDLARAGLRLLDRGRASVSLLLTDDREIRRLNRAFRKLDRATDVLSFPMQDLRDETDPAGDGVLLGDIVISVETARRRAGPARLDKELARLAVHGLAHLFGHDHHRPQQARRMRALERRLLRARVSARA
jgi:probable rRNA maturation factor